jgi:hypothetical protein
VTDSTDSPWVKQLEAWSAAMDLIAPDSLTQNALAFAFESNGTPVSRYRLAGVPEQPLSEKRYPLDS